MSGYDLRTQVNAIAAAHPPLYGQELEESIRAVAMEYAAHELRENSLTPNARADTLTTLVESDRRVMSRRLSADDVKVEHYHSPEQSVLDGGPRGVTITHTPTGLSVSRDGERSQLQNKVAAFKALQDLVAGDYDHHLPEA